MKIQFHYFLAALTIFTGCVATTTDIDRLQDSLNHVQKGQADLIVKINDLDRTLGILNERLSDSNKKMTQFTQKLDDTQTKLGTRMELISTMLSAATTQASVQTPSEVYRTSYADYLSGKTDLAISGFKSFLERYPDSDLADDAQFYIADSYLTKKDFNSARIEFDKVLAASREFRAAALLKRSYALEGSKQKSDQKHTLETLIKEFPESTEAQTAKQILEELEPPKTKTEQAKPSAPSAPNKKQKLE